MSTTDQPYSHKPLGPSCIRLLHLVPGEKHDPFRCYIEVVHLDDNPTYEAISYAWGDPKAVDRVVCYDSLESLVEDDAGLHSSSIWVTSNLASALRYLRQTDFLRPLWIDQLCIDQNNDSERSAQVQIMGSIFSQANETIAWLGTDKGQHAPVALQFFSHLVELPIPKDMRQSGTSLQSLDPMLERRDNPAWEALKHFGLLPYFERVWIVQELQLASSVSFVWAGVRVASIDALRVAYKQYSYLNYRTEIRQHLHHAAANRVMDSLWVRPGYHRLMEAMRIRCATDQRDKLYALNNIADIKMPPPDYAAPLKSAFFNVTKAAIQQKQNLLPTYDKSKYRTDYPDWPSWVPILENSKGQPGGFLRDAIVENTARDAHFRASGDLAFCYSVDDDRMELSVDGFVYDEVISVDRTGWNYNVEPLDLTKCNILPAWNLYRQTAHRTSGAGQEQFRAFVETLIGGRFFYWGSAQPTWTASIYIKFAVDLTHSVVSDIMDVETDESTFKDVIELICHLLDAARSHILDTQYGSLNGELALVEARSMHSWRDDLMTAGELALTRGQSDSEVHELVWRVFDDMSNCFDGTLLQFTRTWAQRGAHRRFCFTRSGTMALAPYLTRPGDLMAIIFGDEMAYALRPVQGGTGRYRLLGEAYVHGIMQGEAIDLLHESGELENQTQKITLV